MAIPLHRYRIIAFVGTVDNSSFPPNQLIIWDDFRRSKIGMIMLQPKILEIKLTKNAIFILVENKILMFELISLKYVGSFYDVVNDINKCSLGFMTNPLVLAYTSQSNKSVIKICKSKNKENFLLFFMVHIIII